MEGSTSLCRLQSVQATLTGTSDGVSGSVNKSSISRWVSRLSSVRLICLLLVLLALSIVVLAFSRAVLMRSESMHREVRAQMSEISNQERREDAERIRGERIVKLLSQAGQMNLLRDGWTERKINIQSVDMRREQVNELMRDIVNNSNQIFGAETFELAVKDPGTSLFDAPRNAEEVLVVTLKGAAMFRASPVKP